MPRQYHAFRLSLVLDPRFAATIDDIVVEFGNSRYQEVMDRFVRGDDVSFSALRRVWQDTSQAHDVWDAPIYEEFFRVVRTVNASLPRERQVRVLLGDPPVNWDSGVPTLYGRADIGTKDRDPHAAELIRREVLAKQRRALVIYGDNHLFRAGQSLVRLLEQTTGTKVFSIANAMGARFEDLKLLQENVTSWRSPSLAIIRGTVLDAKQFTYYDAVLYLGPPSAITFSELSPALCADTDYMAMRLNRMALIAGLRGLSDRLKRYCAAFTAPMK